MICEKCGHKVFDIVTHETMCDDLISDNENAQLRADLAAVENERDELNMQIVKMRNCDNCGCQEELDDWPYESCELDGKKMTECCDSEDLIHWQPRKEQP